MAKTRGSAETAKKSQSTVNSKKVLSTKLAMRKRAETARKAKNAKRIKKRVTLKVPPKNESVTVSPAKSTASTTESLESVSSSASQSDNELWETRVAEQYVIVAEGHAKQLQVFAKVQHFSYVTTVKLFE